MEQFTWYENANGRIHHTSPAGDLGRTIISAQILCNNACSQFVMVYGKAFPAALSNHDSLTETDECGSRYPGWREKAISAVTGRSSKPTDFLDS